MIGLVGEVDASAIDNGGRHRFRRARSAKLALPLRGGLAALGAGRAVRSCQHFVILKRGARSPSTGMGASVKRDIA